MCVALSISSSRRYQRQHHIALRYRALPLTSLLAPFFVCQTAATQNTVAACLWVCVCVLVQHLFRAVLITLTWICCSKDEAALSLVSRSWCQLRFLLSFPLSFLPFFTVFAPNYNNWPKSKVLETESQSHSLLTGPLLGHWSSRFLLVLWCCWLPTARLNLIDAHSVVIHCSSKWIVVCCNVLNCITSFVPSCRFVESVPPTVSAWVPGQAS